MRISAPESIGTAKRRRWVMKRVGVGAEKTDKKAGDAKLKKENKALREELESVKAELESVKAELNEAQEELDTVKAGTQDAKSAGKQ